MKRITLRGILIEIYKKVKYYHSNTEVKYCHSNTLTQKRKLEILINLNKFYIKDFVFCSEKQFGICICLVLFRDLNLIDSKELDSMQNYILSEIDNLDKFHSDKFKAKNKGFDFRYKFESNANRYFFIDYLIKKLTNGNN
jgi:hypothetical protein